MSENEGYGGNAPRTEGGCGGMLVWLLVALVIFAIALAGGGAGSTKTSTSTSTNEVLSPHDNHIMSDNQVNILSVVNNGVQSLSGDKTSTSRTEVSGERNTVDTMVTEGGVTLCRGENGAYTSSNCDTPAP